MCCPTWRGDLTVENNPVARYHPQDEHELPRWNDIFLNSHYDSQPAGAIDKSELAQLLNNQENVFAVVTNELKKCLSASPEYALDVGANVGGMSYRLADLVEQVIAIDTAFNPILTARRLLLKSPMPIPDIRRYQDGLRFEKVPFEKHTPNIEFLLSSIYQLPSVKRFDVITALNVIDVVPDPELFVDKLISHTKQDGLIAITSPYSWGSDDVPLERWLGDKKSGSDIALVELLKSKGLQIEFETDDVPWVLREHDRWYRLFHNHCVIARYL